MEAVTVQRAAVIDIGSNTIKLLVAARDQDSEGIKTLHRATKETRIGGGMSRGRLFFSPETIGLASDAVAGLADEARSFSPECIRIVATSAAREACNAHDLADAILVKTGLELEVLSGQREADLVGGAIQLDPLIPSGDCYVFDLGGGSLECLRFRDDRVEGAVSLPLGCVRLAEKLVADPSGIFTRDDERKVGAEVENVIAESSFLFSLPPEAIAVGTGGTLTTALNIMAAEEGLALEEMGSRISVDDLRALLRRTGALPLPERLSVDRLTIGRADVFPTALAILLKLVELCGRGEIHHSFLNLRYGLAAEILNGSQIKRVSETEVASAD